MQKILCIGPTWRGSDADGLFNALSRVGHVIAVVDENYYINLSNKSFKVKALDFVFRNWHISEFNNAILREAKSFSPTIALVYKGAFLLPSTLVALKKKGIICVNFYPDVSFRAHGKLLPKTLPLYNHIFTTKSFGVSDMKSQLNISCSTFIPHGFDPDIHRKIDVSTFDNSYFDCDVTFIGGWSEKKERYLSAIKNILPEVNLKIWGGRWENATSSNLKSSIMYAGILGDLYTIGINSSKIVLGLVHEQVIGSSSGDLITARSFQIPGAGAFMMHERTPEIGIYFKEDKEIVCFSNEEELIEKISYYLNNESDRIKIANEGYLRSLKEHSLDARANLVMSYIDPLLHA